MRCSAIIVTYNSAQAIGPCLEALTREDCEIVVVDNASHDQTVPRVEEFVAWHPLRLIANEQNLGFAAAANQGAREATGDVLLLLNPDAIAEPGAIAALLRCFATTQAAAVGGSLLEGTGQLARGFAFRRIPTLASLLCEVLLINHLWPGNPVNRRYRYLDADYSQQQEVEQPAGACLAITRTAWESVGGCDEQFFPVWFEDVDLCQRLLDGGSRIFYCPAARFRHAGAHSVGQLSFQDKQLFWYFEHVALRPQALLNRTSLYSATGHYQRHAAALAGGHIRSPASTTRRNPVSLLECHTEGVIGTAQVRASLASPK